MPPGEVAAMIATTHAPSPVSQQKLAARRKVTARIASLLERVTRQPTLVVVIAIGQALKVDPVVLVRMTLARLQREES